MTTPASPPRAEAASPPGPGLYAHLPGGEWLAPGDTGDVPEGVRVCSGPDDWGCCPAALAGETPACAGAEWFKTQPGRGDRVWRFRYLEGTGACPAASIEPLRALGARPARATRLQLDV